MSDGDTFPWLFAVVGGFILLGIFLAIGTISYNRWQRRRRLMSDDSRDPDDPNARPRPTD